MPSTASLMHKLKQQKRGRSEAASIDLSLYVSHVGHVIRSVLHSWLYVGQIVLQFNVSPCKHHYMPLFGKT